jgi:FtsP/CotA-like multicopper oxidase with cupredoxin domain
MPGTLISIIDITADPSPSACRRAPASRRIPVDLTGAMEGYSWVLNGLTYGQDKPLIVGKGERVEITMANRTMVSHPMHLHGHAFQVVAVDGTRFAGTVRDTVLVSLMQAVADNLSRWPFHCNNLYHMEAGTMTTVQYATF